jgi:hypothetical protein
MRKHHARLFRFAVAVGVTVAVVAPARASLIVALDAPAMVERADDIAVVDVASVRAAWDAGHERIVTTVELVVVESWKGAVAPAARVVVAQAGGTVGDVTMTVFGMPRFSPGERALVFLHGPTDRARVVGLAQGKRAMRRAGAAWLVAPPERAGAAFVRRAASLQGLPPVFDAGPRPLDELRAEVRALVARGGVR